MKKVVLMVMLASTLCAEPDVEEVFTSIYEKRVWGTKSVSGDTLEQTRRIRVELPKLLKQLGIKTLLDAACGDFYWMQHVNLSGVNYIGMDIVEDIIKTNKKYYETDQCLFIYADIMSEDLPCVDMILCRSCFIHLSFEDIFKAIANFKRSGSKYLLTTSFTDRQTHEDTPTGGSRPINLELPPFNFPKPIAVINEGCTLLNGTRKDKSLALWKLADLP